MKKILGYALYTLIITIFFLYYYFPADKAAELVSGHLKRSMPDLSFSIGAIQPIFPPGLAVYNFQVENKKRKIIDANQLKIQPNPVSLITGRPIINYNCDAYGGTFDGFIAIERQKEGIPLIIDIQWHDIKLSEVTQLLEINQKIDADLEGSFQLTGLKDNLLHGTGEGQLVLSNIMVELNQAVFNMIKTISFKSIHVKLIYNNYTVAIDKCIINGDLMGNMSGAISLKPSFNDSLLNLKGTVKPSQAFMNKNKNLPFSSFLKPDMLKNGIPVSISGTIGRPYMRMI